MTEGGKSEYGRSTFKYCTRTELSVIWIVTSWPEHAILFRYALNLFQSVCQQVRCMCCNIDGARLKQFGEVPWTRHVINIIIFVRGRVTQATAIHSSFVIPKTWHRTRL